MVEFITANRRRWKNLYGSVQDGIRNNIELNHFPTGSDRPKVTVLKSK